MSKFEKIDRRSFIKTSGLVAGATAASTLAAPAVAKSRVDLVIVSTWPRDFPGLGISAQRHAKRIEELTEGEIKVTLLCGRRARRRLRVVRCGRLR